MKTKPAELKNKTRRLEEPKTNDQELGPLKVLPGKWANLPNLPGRGWNMIALPFVAPPPPGVPFPLNYRLLVNQYNEELEFTLVDKAVPNRGVRLAPGTPANTDQFLVALDYQQRVTQIASDDFPQSTVRPPDGSTIHHEPGLWLHMTNGITDGLNIGRLATIPHGDSVLALGRSGEHPGTPTIPYISGLPIGVDQDLNNPYLAPYKHFGEKQEKFFKGLFNPVSPNDLLEGANQGVEIEKTTVLDVDTTRPTGGIVNIPFVVRQANATVMKATFWIQELKEKDKYGKPKLRLQYSQLVMLDFFPRVDGQTPGCCPGLIQWPHVSINTMEKVVE
ncbi:MAG: heme-binding protein [Nitrospirota bacterium]